MEIIFGFLISMIAIAFSQHIMDSGVKRRLNFTAEQNTRVSDNTTVTFLLFSRRNPSIAKVLISDDSESIAVSEFNPINPTRFLIHGWNGGPSDSINSLCRRNYLTRGDYNIFVVDWSLLASAPYMTATVNLRVAGKQTAAFIDFLNRNHGLNLASTYIVGHSLGAHVAGMAGKYVKSGKIRAIFGLDPAQPLFSIDRPNERLDANDAEYVESIHTNTAFKGFAKPIGDSSFYPNWGRRQPGCGTDLLGSCSHARVVYYFAESLEGTNKFYGVRCKSYDNIEKQACNGVGTMVKMGGDIISSKGRGVYYVPVGEKYPFAMGKVPYIHLRS